MADEEAWGFSRAWVRRIIRSVKRTENFRMTGAVRWHRGQESMSAHVFGGAGGGGAAVESLIVVEIENDHLVCKRMDDEGAPTGDEIKVAKPPELRHDASYYEGVETLTSDGPQRATFAYDDAAINDEDVVVKPPYVAYDDEEGATKGTRILAVRADMAGEVEVEEGEGEEAEDVPLVWQDVNVAGRVWGLDA